MKLSADDREAVQEALREVRVRAEACAQTADLDDAKRALGAVRAAAVKAYALINDLDASTRAKADAKNTAELFARLERISA